MLNSLEKEIHIPPQLLQEILCVAKKYPQIYKIVLYGSRARGDNNPTSDIDIAVYTDNNEPIFQFIDDIDEKTNTLLKFDIAFINLNSNPSFIQNIEKDGVILMSTFQEKLTIFQKAVDNLAAAVKECNEAKNELMRDGVIQRFEYTAELAWKTTRAYLLEQGIKDIKLPKGVMKEAYAAGLITNDVEWNDLLNSRNMTSHLYDENLANDIYIKIKNIYLPLFLNLTENFK